MYKIFDVLYSLISLCRIVVQQEYIITVIHKFLDGYTFQSIYTNDYYYYYFFFKHDLLIEKKKQIIIVLRTYIKKIYINTLYIEITLNIFKHKSTFYSWCILMLKIFNNYILWPSEITIPSLFESWTKKHLNTILFTFMS